MQEMSYGKLAEKYNGFLAPALRLLVDGVSLTDDLGLQISELTISLSLRRAGSVQFRVEGVYELSSRTFRDEAKEALKPGKRLEAELGYGSEYTKVFVGYIAEEEYDYSETPGIRVTALDVRRMLMDTIRQNLKYEVKSCSQALEAVMKPYGRYYDKLEAEETPNAFPQIVQKGSDYKFIQELCQREKKEFLMVGGTIYFRTPEKEKTPVVSLEWGNGLASFQERKSCANQVIRVYGQDENQKERVVVELSTGDGDGVPAVWEFYNYTLIGEAAVRAYAEEQLRARKGRTITGSGSCIGLPELAPGSMIRLEKLDAATGVYYMTDVRHSFGRSGFTTQFHIQRKTT